MDTLTKLYVEITAHCNLSCQMCIQRVWHEPIGAMSLETFRNLLEALKRLPQMPTIHLGGYGEPMVHPQFFEIVTLAKDAGARLEMTTNGTMLTKERAERLVDLGLDEINVSVDGANPEHYNQIRVNSDYGKVINNLRHLNAYRVRRGGRHGLPRIALAFVAMKSNIEDLPELPRLASVVGAWTVKVSNVVPHTPEMEQEILYRDSLNSAAYRESNFAVAVNLPKFDLDPLTSQPMQEIYASRANLTINGRSLSARDNYCRFAQEGFAAIRWDGEVSPCLSLLHDHPEYIRGRRKDITHHSFGNINETPYDDLWYSEEFIAFRQKVRDWPFSPCTTCGGCERFPQNYEDCSENTFPTCGGCLWAQGLIECP